MVCASWCGLAEEAGGLPTHSHAAREPAHEGSTREGRHGALGSERQEVWGSPSLPVPYQRCGLGEAASLLSKEVVR